LVWCNICGYVNNNSGLEEFNMQNKVWEQVGDFLNKLRCENVTRDSAVEVPGYRNTQQELEEMRGTCEAIIRSLPEGQRQSLLEWMAKLDVFCKHFFLKIAGTIPKSCMGKFLIIACPSGYRFGHRRDAVAGIHCC
jgi:hypothetical protein